jgi:hypothetical protein
MNLIVFKSGSKSRYLSKSAPFLILLCLLLSGYTFGQAGFEKRYTISGGTLSHLITTNLSNGDLCMVSNISPSAGISHLVVTRVGTSANSLWSKNYETANSFIPVTIAATPDTGAVIVLFDTVQQSDVQILKIDYLGQLSWSKRFNSSYLNLEGPPVAVLPGGAIVVATSSQDSVYLKKLSATGNLLWERYIKDSSPSVVFPNSLLHNNGDLYLQGYDANSYTEFLLRLDSLGNLIWKKYDFGSKNLHSSIFAKPSGSLLFATRDALDRPLVLDVNNQGNINWTKKYSLVLPYFFPVNQNQLALVSFENNLAKILTLDTLGITTFSGSVNFPAQMIWQSACPAKLNSIWLAACGSNSVWVKHAVLSNVGPCALQSFTASVETLSLTSKNLAYSNGSRTSSIASFTVTGQNFSWADSLLCQTPTRLKTYNAEIASIHPNPAGSSVIIEFPDGQVFSVEIYSAAGKKVKTFNDVKATQAVLDISSLSPGIYFLELRSAAVSYRQKLIVQP